MKKAALLMVTLFPFSMAVAQKLTKEEKKKLKEEKKIAEWCNEAIKVEEDPFTGDKQRTLMFGGWFMPDLVRVGPRLWMGIREKDDVMILSSRLVMQGDRDNTIEAGQTHGFVLGEGDQKQVISLKTLSNVIPVVSAVGNSAAATLQTEFRFDYELTDHQVNLFKNLLLQAVKLQVSGVDLIEQVDNVERSQKLRNGFQCITK